MKHSFIRLMRSPGTVADMDIEDTPADIEKQRLENETAAAALAASSALAAANKEFSNEDGTPKEGYIKGEDGKFIPDPAKPPVTPETETTEDAGGSWTPEEFFTEVDKLHGGDPLEIEYPEGVEPLSPAGIHIRDKAMMERGATDFENWFKTTDPRSYAYMLHRQAGGSDDEFLQNKTFSLPEYEVFKTNADIQAKVYKDDLIAKGIDADNAQLLVDKAVKDGKIFDVADKAYKAVQTKHQTDLSRIENAKKAADAEYSGNLNKVVKNLDTLITDNKGLNIAIPDADKVAFRKFVGEHIEYDSASKTFVITQPIADGSLARQLEALYLIYKNGDLGALIKRSAESQNVRKIQKKVEKTVERGGNNTPAQRPGFVSMDQV